MAYTGTGASLQVGKEASWGSAAAGAKNANMLSESIKLNATKTVEDTLIAAKAPSAKLLMGLDVSGDFSGILKPENAGYLLHLALGGTDTVGTGVPVASAYTHTIVAQAAGTALPSFTTIVDRRVSIKKYSGCKMQSFRLEGAVADYVRYTASILAKDESSGSLAGLSALALKSFKTVTATLHIAGTEIAAKKVTLNIGNMLEDTGQTYGSGLYKGEPIHGTREITVDVELNYETVVDTIDATNYQTDTVAATVIWVLESPSMVVGTTPYRVTVTLNNVAIDGIERNVSGAAIIPARITGTATAVSTTEPISVAVIDATSTAYSA
jgi:hypothetical protein